MENPIRTRINVRFECTKKSKAKAAEHIGMARTYLTDFLAGSAGSIKFELLPKLAEFLECHQRYLTGEALNPDGSGNEQIEVRQVIRATAQRTVTLVKPMIVHGDDRYMAAEQTGYLIEGDDWRNLGFCDGAVVIARSIAQKPGDSVVYKIRGKGAQIGTVRDDGSVIDATGDAVPDASVLGSITLVMRIL